MITVSDAPSTLVRPKRANGLDRTNTPALVQTSLRSALPITPPFLAALSRALMWVT
jgi:hypothetical protein